MNNFLSKSVKTAQTFQMFASLNNRLHSAQAVTPELQVFPLPPYGATGLEVSVSSGSFSLSDVKLCGDFIDGLCLASKVPVLIPLWSVLAIEYLTNPNASGAWVQTTVVTIQSRLEALTGATIRVKTGPSNAWVKGVIAQVSAGWVRLGAVNQRWLALSSIEAIQVLAHPQV